MQLSTSRHADPAMTAPPEAGDPGHTPAESPPQAQAAVATPHTPAGRGRALWGTRGFWLGPVAWLLAQAGTLLLAGEDTRTLAEGLLALAGGLAVLAWGAQRPRPAFAGPRWAGPLLRWDVERVLRLGGIALAAGLAWRADSEFLRRPWETFGNAGWLWVMSMAALLVATVGWPAHPTTGKDAPEPPPTAAGTAPARRARGFARYGEPAALAGLLALAVILRVWDLRDVPFAIHGDEILTGQNAITGYLNGQAAPIFSTLWDNINLPALWFALVAASLKIGGITLAALRLPAALFGAATVVPFYGLVRLGWGRVAALAGTTILAVSASNLQYSRVTINNIVTPFFWTVCFFVLLRGLRGRRPADWALAGLAAGLSEYGYYGTHLLPFLLLIFGGYLLIVHGRQAVALLGHFGLLALGYVVAFGPLLAYYTRHPELYLGRGAGALTWDHIPRDWADLQAMVATLWPLFAENLLGISTHGDEGSLYTAPLLLPAEAALLVLGVALLIWQWRHPPAFLLLLTGGGVLFVGGTLVHGVPFLPHWTPAFPAFYAALAVPVGAWWASARTGNGTRRNTEEHGWGIDGGINGARRHSAALGGLFSGRGRGTDGGDRKQPGTLLRRGMGAVLALGLVAIAGMNIQFYFFQYQVARPEFEIHAAQSRWEAALGPDYRVRTVGPSWQDYNPDFNAYLIAGQDGAAMRDPATMLPLPGDAQKGLAFVFFPDDDAFRPLVLGLYPGGTTGEVMSHTGVHLFYTYVLTPAQAQAAYGLQLDVVAADGRSYRRQARVATVGPLPADVRGPLRAHWSGSLYRDSGGPLGLALDGAAGVIAVDGAPLPAEGATLGAGWHRLDITAAFTAPAAPALRVTLGDAGAVRPGVLWPTWPPDAQ